ncbi:RagB/SusD family nutrient uptake outer membrane protein [Pontibacter sp. SGAir0037]|uniref:RagB/SusD family nutrient uptake outer membrane protein n=1 Tax=Pontibacter sp. SGAir0037 TaxID=2571030 RepID=UPI0010CCB1D4|nr:RagB/SusD family nutrient uptake outer membrane protein [Pontibacter sp. SGAir0037]QCR23115.1 RagB/SusD family nutrient uptake outer membrane protein [Pontibacter sp. SGAir0037]
MKRFFIKISYISALLLGCLTACDTDLDLTPTNATTSVTVYSTPEGYKQVLAKVYGAFALTGNDGSGSSDLGGIDAGTSDFLRLYWNAQELTTEEAHVTWNDPGLPNFHNLNWTSGNIMLTGLYNRIFYQITVANEFIRESTDAKLSERGIAGADAEDIRHYRAEARFLRAFQYWVAMDLFGNPPFVTENDPIGKFMPPQISRAELFAYVESELLAIESMMVAPRQNEYGRADQAAAWALLARLYLNAQVYTGEARYTDAITYAKKVIDSGYTLKSNYRELFLADNDVNNSETILSINYDVVNTQNYGGTTYIINAAVNAEMNPAAFGVPGGGWGGVRSTKSLPFLFSDYSGNTDKRAMFYGNKPEMDDPSAFSDGLKVTKFRNITSTGATPQPGGTYVSTDFPLIRLAEMYLIYAEAVLRGGTGGNTGTALEYINALRTRAYGNASGNVGSISLDFILDERGRELYWEAFRRTDLIRYGRFTSGDYVWPWKGGVKEGRGVSDIYRLFPIPSSDLGANTNLVQNTGY